MTVSSRTPEGQPGTCPICSASVVVEPSILFGDATCPRCGQLLWFVQISEQSIFFPERSSMPSKDRVAEYIAVQLGVDRDRILNNPQIWNEIAADSLDTVELLMMIEQEYRDD
jgi:hypothetical protein